MYHKQRVFGLIQSATLGKHQDKQYIDLRMSCTVRNKTKEFSIIIHEELSSQLDKFISKLVPGTWCYVEGEPKPVQVGDGADAEVKNRLSATILPKFEGTTIQLIGTIGKVSSGINTLTKKAYLRVNIKVKPWSGSKKEYWYSIFFDESVCNLTNLEKYLEIGRKIEVEGEPNHAMREYSGDWILQLGLIAHTMPTLL